MSEMGHNSLPQGRERVRAIIADVVHSTREIDGLKTDISEIYKAAKEEGFDTKALRLAVKRYMESPTKRQDRQAVEDTADLYLHAAGKLPDDEGDE